METAANCADPAKVVADITIGASQPIPAERASRPNEMPKPSTATASGATARAPARYLRSGLPSMAVHGSNGRRAEPSGTLPSMPGQPGTEVPFRLVDVFCERPFAGNQLCVVPEPVALDDATMQSLAREIGF